MIVVDTNVIAYLYLNTEFSARAEDLLLQDPEWAAPLLWRSELRNILAGCLRRKSISLDDAQRIQHEAETLMAGNEFDVDSRLVLQLVQASSCSAYDCEFIALATQRGINLVTMDRQLLKAFPRQTTALSAT